MNRKIIPAALAAVLTLTLLGGCAKPAEPAAVQPPVPSQAEVLPEEDAAPAKEEPQPAEQAPSEEESKPFAAKYTCTYETVQADVEEIVSYTIQKPVITTESDAANAALAEKFDALTAQFRRNCENEVYERAQELQAIAVVDIGCAVTEEGGKLFADYTMQTEYRLADPTAEEWPISEGSLRVCYDLAQECFVEE